MDAPLQQQQSQQYSKQQSRRESGSRKRSSQNQHNSGANQPHASIMNMGTLQLVADSSRVHIPLTRNEVHGGSTSQASNGAQGPSMPSSVASSGLNFAQFMKEAPLQFTKRRMTADNSAVTERANSSQSNLLHKKQRLIRKKEHNQTSGTLANQNSVPSEKRHSHLQNSSPRKTQHPGQLSSRPSSSHQLKQPGDFNKQVTKGHVITEEMIEAKRIKMKPISSSLYKVVHLQKAQSSRQTPVQSRPGSQDKQVVGASGLVKATLKNSKNMRISASSANLNQLGGAGGPSRKVGGSHVSSKNALTRTTHNLHLSLASKAKGNAGESSKPGSQQSTARNIPKGAITFHNKQHDKGDYDSKNDSKTKKKKEHPTFFEVKPNQICIDKNSNKPGPSKDQKQSFVNFLNKAPLPKPQPCLIQKQESSSHSESTTTAAVSSLLQQNKSIAHTLSNLLSDLKSLFFYEESATLRDQLRSIVYKYETLTKDEMATLKPGHKNDRSRSTSLDTKERLKAFINRQDHMQKHKQALGSSSQNPNDSAACKEDFDEIDLKNSIQSIDQRLSVLIGQTQQMFAAHNKLSEVANLNRSPSKDLLKLTQKATNSQTGTATTAAMHSNSVTGGGLQNADLFSTKQQLDDINLLRSSQESIKNVQSSAASSSRRATSPSPFIFSGQQTLSQQLARPASSTNMGPGYHQSELQHQSQPKANQMDQHMGLQSLSVAAIDPHKRSQSVTSRSHTKNGSTANMHKRKHLHHHQQQLNSQSSSPIGNLQKALLQIGQQTQSYEVKHTFVKHFSARLQLLEELAWKYQSEVPQLYDHKQRSRQPVPESSSCQNANTNPTTMRTRQTANSHESPAKSVAQGQVAPSQPMMMFETSDKHIASAVAPHLSLEAHQKQLEEKEAELKRQESEQLISKEKVFAKWQEHIEHSEKLEQKEIEVQKMLESLKAREADLEQKAKHLAEKEASLNKAKTQMASNSSGDSLHSVFFISEKEAQLKQKEHMLQLRQEELERRADEISTILKTFSNKGPSQSSNTSVHDLPLQRKEHSSSEEDRLHLDSVCDLPVQMRADNDTHKLHLDLFRQQEPLLESPTQTEDIDKSKGSRPEESTLQKYESPKFFVGSGSPFDSKHKRQHSDAEDEKESKRSDAKANQSSAAPNNHRDGEVEQHFSFQRTQLLTDQSQDEEEYPGETEIQNRTSDLMSEDQDYGESFAAEFKLKQQKMLGELQSIYDVKTDLSQQLNQITQGLTVQDPEEVGPADGVSRDLMILAEQSSMPEAVKTVVETPSSLANDSQLHQLLSNMHNQLKDMEGDSDDEDERLLSDRKQNNTIDEELTLAKEIAQQKSELLLFDDEESQEVSPAKPEHTQKSNSNRSNKQLNNSL